MQLSLLQDLENGVPYTAATASGVDPRPNGSNPGYLTPPTGSQTIYYFTARDAFRLEGQKRTDFAANYNYDLNVGTRRLGFFVQAQVVNLFNQFQLCGCGANVFLNGGTAQSRFVDQAVRTAVTNAALYRTFNPFAETPVQGVHWDLSPASAMSPATQSVARAIRYDRRRIISECRSAPRVPTRSTSSSCLATA